MQGEEMRAAAEAIWRAGVAAVDGYACVAEALAGQDQKFDLILGVGKAAVPMCEAALARLARGGRALAVTKYGHGDRQHPSADGLEILEAAHPVPDANSIAAGARLLDAVVSADKDCRLLLLVSGGASALAEAPVEDVTLDMLQAKNAELLASGLDIHAMNAERRKFSRIKGGGLLAAFGGAAVQVLAISDVRSDDIAVIGSGIGAPPAAPAFDHDCRIVASNAIARAAAARRAGELGLAVRANEETLYGTVEEGAAHVAAALLAGEAGVYLFGGEPVIQLPDAPGEGGRNQALAAMVAREIAGRDELCVLAAGTDGTDGPTHAAGGLVDGGTWAAMPGGADALTRADSGTWLKAAGARFTTGPTGTNVMDLVVGVKAGLR